MANFPIFYSNVLITNNWQVKVRNDITTEFYVSVNEHFLANICYSQLLDSSLWFVFIGYRLILIQLFFSFEARHIQNNHIWLIYEILLRLLSEVLGGGIMHIYTLYKRIIVIISFLVPVWVQTWFFHGVVGIYLRMVGIDGKILTDEGWLMIAFSFWVISTSSKYFSSSTENGNEGLIKFT